VHANLEVVGCFTLRDRSDDGSRPAGVEQQLWNGHCKLRLIASTGFLCSVADEFGLDGSSRRIPTTAVSDAAH
jgi:hypothetical protein